MISENVSWLYPEAQLTIDGFDDCIIGIDEDSFRLIYSVGKIIEKLMSRDGMGEEDAREFYDFNIGQAYFGEYTPIYCDFRGEVSE